MDKYWQEVTDYVQSISPDGFGIAAHEDFKVKLPLAVPYGEIESYDADFFHGLVLHKSLYEQIDPSFLREFMSRAKPTFANEVFVVLRTDGTALKRSNIHLGDLRKIAHWAAGQADTWGARCAPEEPPLSADRALTQMTDFIVQNLAKPLDSARPDSPVAIAETAERFSDTAWFWADDSGKNAELFAVPQVRDACPELADAALDHVLRLSPDSVIQRRSGAPDLKLVDANPEAFRAYNSFFNLTGNLKAGIVRPSIRFNDTRTRFLADYSGNVLRFRYRGRRQAVDVERAISAWSIEEHPDRIVFSHTSAIEARPRIGWRRHVCNLTYRYSLWKARPAIELETEISTMPSVTLGAVQVSTAFDQMCNGGNFDTVAVGLNGKYKRYAPPKQAITTLHTGPAEYLGIWEAGVMPGFAHGFHVRFRSGNELGDIIAEGSRPGQFHWVYPRYTVGRMGPEKTHRIVEDRLLTGGGYYGEPGIYCRVLDEMTSATFNVDPSMSYDIGAELNAVALTILFAKDGFYRCAPSAERLQALREWYDRHLKMFLMMSRPADLAADRTVFVRGLSFVILSLDCMVRAFASDEYRDPLALCVGLLLRLEIPVEGGRGETIFSVPNPPELDCHCSALLALARVAVHGDPEGRIVAALRRALWGTLILNTSAEQYGQPGLTFESLGIRSHAGVPPHDTGFWCFKLGLALRAFNAIRQVAATGFLSLDSETIAHVDKLDKVARRALLPTLRRENGTLEALTSQCSGETNSETQPWVALGLVPAVEWKLFGTPAETDVQLTTRAEPAARPPRESVVCFDQAAPPMQVELDCSEPQTVRLFQRVTKTWEGLGQSKPHWSVLSNDAYLPSNIANSQRDFFATGEHDRNRLLATIRRVGRDPTALQVTHEFGCGLGRLTNYLAESFERVIACDVSRQHLDLARARSTKIGRTNIDYRLATLPTFGMDSPFDLWFSIIVLQHNPPPIMTMILRRALKLLRPGGIAVFQIPTYSPNYRFNIEEYLACPAPPLGIEMHFLPQSALFKLINEAGCSLLEITHDGMTGAIECLSNSVVITK